MTYASVVGTDKPSPRLFWFTFLLACGAGHLVSHNLLGRLRHRPSIEFDEQLLQPIHRVVVIATHLPDEALPLTSSSTQSVDASLQEAKHLGHNYVGTEHLILAVTRQQGAALQSLAIVGINPQDLRCEVLNLLGHFVDPWPLPGGAM